MTKEELIKSVIEINNEDGLGRQIIIDQMHANEDEGNDCLSCVGHCCTYEHNSMMIEPFEALSIVINMGDKLNLEILDENIKKYRLDKLISIGSKQMRRYYTCPYFEPGSGCGVDKDVKPFGCLAFNPLEKNVSKTGFCKSIFPDSFCLDSQLHDRIHNMNHLISSTLGLSWSKESIPVALKDVFVTLNAS